MNARSSRLLTLVRYVNDKGFFHLLSANFLIQVVAFASQLFVAGILSPEDIGRIKIIQIFLSVFSIIAGLGFNASTLKLCSENRTKIEEQRIFRSAVIFTISSTLILYVIVLILNAFSIFSADKLIKWLIPIGMFPLISNSVFMVFISYFQATKKIKLMSRLTMGNKIISIGAIILLTYWFGIKGYYFAYNLSFILMVFVGFRMLRRDLSTQITGFNLKSLFPVHWQYARSSMFANLLAELSAYIDILLINYFITDMPAVGQYSFALTLTVALRIIPATVQQIATPYFSGYSHSKVDFLNVFRKYNKLLYLVVFGTLISALFIVPPAISFIFAGKYDAAMPYFLILATGWSIRQLTQLQSGAIFGLGKIKFNAYTALFSLAFNVIIYPVFIYFWGIKGAALANIPSALFILMVSYLYFRKALKE